MILCKTLEKQHLKTALENYIFWLVIIDFQHDKQSELTISFKNMH